MMCQCDRKGMTLVEVVMAVSLIGILVVLMVPAFNMARQYRENSRTASQLRRAVAAFELYKSEMGSYPADKTPGVIPPEMAGYFKDLDIYDTTDDDHSDEWWTEVNDLGGKWDWDNGYHYAYSISISAPTKSLDQMRNFDKLVDDGNLETGNFRKNGVQYHYILEE